MLIGKSILHVDQGVGKIYSFKEVKGYYNDLTHKVLKDKDLNEVKIPVFNAANGSAISFPITIFQYGLGAYDLYLLNGHQIFLDKFKMCADWALTNQENSGAWNTFFFIKPDAPYSAMAQGEGASLLIRAYKESGNPNYLAAAEKAINFMVLPVEKGGTAQFYDTEVIFLEVTNIPVILNGWIFSLFGLLDFLIVFDDEKIREIFECSLKALANRLESFDTGYWSKYDNEKRVASLFYHKLHIAQLQVLYELTGNAVFQDYCEKWTQYQNSFINKKRAFVVKAIQKIME